MRQSLQIGFIVAVAVLALAMRGDRRSSASTLTVPTGAVQPSTAAAAAPASSRNPAPPPLVDRPVTVETQLVQVSEVSEPIAVRPRPARTLHAARRSQPREGLFARAWHALLGTGRRRPETAPRGNPQ